MKAISVKQPWASLIACGLKTIETRTWRTKYRGDILIVSSQKPKIEGMTSGMALCIAKIIGCRPMEKLDERLALCKSYPGAYAWILSEIRKIEPFEVKGQLGIYEVNYNPETDGKTI